MKTNSNSIPIKTITVVEAKRLATLVKHFGSSCITFESLMYDIASSLCPDYKGGYWTFLELTNGGFYMSPTDSESYKIEVIGNYYQGELSADAIGIVVTIFAINFLICKTKNDDAIEKLSEKYHLLLDYAQDHKESSKIFSAID